MRSARTRSRRWWLPTSKTQSCIMEADPFGVVGSARRETVENMFVAINVRTTVESTKPKEEQEEERGSGRSLEGTEEMDESPVPWYLGGCRRNGTPSPVLGFNPRNRRCCPGKVQQINRDFLPTKFPEIEDGQNGESPTGVANTGSSRQNIE